MATTTVTAEKAMSGTTELTKRTEFRRPLNGGGYAVLMLNEGERVKYERRETDKEIIYTASVVRDGYTWRSVKRWEKEGAKEGASNGASKREKPSVTTESVKHTGKVTGAAVKAVAGKRNVYGADEMESRVNILSKAADLLEGDIYMLQYDIPDVFKKTCPNPSRIFRHYGYRLNLSCWVMPRQGLDSEAVEEVLNHWKDIPTQETQEPGMPYVTTYRVKFHVIKYAADQLEEIRRIAREELEDELKRIHTSLIRRLGSASDALEAAEKALGEREDKGEEVTQEDLDKVRNTYVGSLRGTLRDAIDCFEGALKAAEAFDETAQLRDLFAGVRAAIRTEVMAVNVQLATQGRKTVTLPKALSS